MHKVMESNCKSSELDLAPVTQKNLPKALNYSLNSDFCL